MPDAARSDAGLTPDAYAALDSFSRMDAGTSLRGCFEGDLEIEGRTSFDRVHGIVGYDQGWIVFGQEGPGAFAVFLDLEGHWVGRSDYEGSESELTQFFVAAESVYAFGPNSLARFALGDRQFARVYAREALDWRTVGRLGEGFRALGPLVFRGSMPRVTDIVADDASPSGVRLTTGVMPSVDFLEASAFPASVSIVEDHLQVRHSEGPSAAAMRVVDVQLGAAPGGDDVVGVRVWSTTSVPWNHAFTTMTEDAARWVGTTRATVETERVVEVVSRERSWPLLRGEVVRGWGESAGRYVVLTDDAFHVFRASDVARLGDEVRFAPLENEWPELAVRGEFAAAVFERSQDASGRRFAVRCMQLPLP